MRHRLLLIAVAVAGLVVIGLLLVLRPGSPINKASFDRIQVGHTKEDVEALLGPPGDYSSGPLWMVVRRLPTLALFALPSALAA
jgi:hypothetical protein